MNVFDMALYGKIRGGGGGGSDLGTKTVNANGVYNASSDNLDGYSKVTVNVPNTYSAGDEGKVVSNGALVPQTSKNISSNGTVDTTTNNQVVVNVEPYFTSRGTAYYKDYTVPKLWTITYYFADATEMESIIVNDNRQWGGSGSYQTSHMFDGCTKLKTVHCPYTTSVVSGFCDIPFNGCTALEDVTFGSIGNPVTSFTNSTSSSFYMFKGLTQSTLTITLYVNANSIADISTDITSRSPWGATNATIIYKNSTTGEVLS